MSFRSSTPPRRVLPVAALVLALGLLTALPAGATSYTWTNASGGSWSTSTNWSPSGVPTTGDAVTLPTLSGAYAVTLDANASIAALTVGSGATLQMATNDSLSYTGTALQNDGVIVVGPTSKNTFFLANTSDTLQISGSGAIQLQGQGRIFSALSRPTLHYRIVNGAGHTISGDGSIFVPITNRGDLVQAGTGNKLLTLVQYLWNAGTVHVSDGGTINVRYFVSSNGGSIIGHNGSLMVRPTDQLDLYNYGPIDGLQGGCTLVADGGNLDLTVGVSTSATVVQTGGSGLVAFHTSSNPNNVVVTAGAEALFDGGTNFHIDTGAIENHGTIHVQGTMTLGGSLSDTVNTSSDGTLLLEGGTIMGGLNMSGDSQWLLNNGTITGCGTIAGNFINAGTVDVECPVLEESIVAKSFINRGRITIGRGYLHFAGATGTVRNIGTIDGANGGIVVDQGAVIQNTGGVLNAGSGLVHLGGKGAAATIVGGTLGAGHGGYFFNTGASTLQDVTLAPSATFITLERAATTASGVRLVNMGTNDVKTGGTFVTGPSTDYVQPSGLTLLEGGTLSAPRGFTVFGALRGAGTVVGAVTNAGEVSPSSAGLQIQGDYHQTHRGALNFSIGGYAANQFSHLGVTGAATLDGSVAASGAGGFVPDNDHSFDVMAFGSRSGQFSSIDAAAGFAVSTLYDNASLSLLTPTTPLAVTPNLPATVRFYGRGMGFGLELPALADVNVSAYDLSGRRVAVLANGMRPAGVHSFELSPAGLPSGVYFARATLRTGAHTEVREARVVFLR